MNASFRVAAVSVAAFLFSLTPGSVLAAPADQLSLRWSELQPVFTGRQISVRLTDGATVDGRYSSLQSDALWLQVAKTSDPARHPKGASKLARPELAQVTVKRHTGWKGRTIGLIAGGVVTAVVGSWAVALSKTEGGNYGRAAGVGTGGAIGIGYLIGWLGDSARSRPPRDVRILPDEPVR